jgi:hypothetical protein
MLWTKEMAYMSKTRLMLLSLVAVLAVVAVSASAASAAVTFLWKVNKNTLKAGESRTFNINNDRKTFDLSGTVAGVGTLLLSTEVSVEPGARIIGGQPGTNLEVVLFRGVTVHKPAKCAVGNGGTIKTVPLTTEIVESAAVGVETGEALILFRPETGGTFAEFELTNKGAEVCALGGISLQVGGNILGLPLPIGEVLRQNLIFEARTKEYRPFGGTAKKAGLLFGGNAATLTGLVLVLLTSDEAFEAF